MTSALIHTKAMFLVELNLTGKFSGIVPVARCVYEFSIYTLAYTTLGNEYLQIPPNLV